MDWPYPIERQREEFASAADAAKAVEGPLLVVGDFNSTPWSYVMKGFESSTDLRRETRNLMTYPELFTLPSGLIRLEPFLPLDHVFQRGMIISELHLGEQTGSDHRPVVFTVSVAP
jgi:endonuclease/exonuclease/phosphatase (EEP) superfamily protein YafD